MGRVSEGCSSSIRNENRLSNKGVVEKRTTGERRRVAITWVATDCRRRTPVLSQLRFSSGEDKRLAIAIRLLGPSILIIVTDGKDDRAIGI